MKTNRRIIISEQKPLTNQKPRTANVGRAQPVKHVSSPPCDYERRNNLLSSKQELSQIVESHAMFLAVHFGEEETVKVYKPAVVQNARRGKRGGALPMKPLGYWN